MSLWLIGILILGGPHWFLRLLENLFLLVHLLLGLSLIRSRIGSLPIFMGRGTAALHYGTAAVRHYRSRTLHCHGLCRLIYTNFALPLKLHTLIAIHYPSFICLGSFYVAEAMLD